MAAVTLPHAPRVEMLWETGDPLRALDERFGFRDRGSATTWLAATLNEHWGVRVVSCERIVISDHNALAWVETAAGALVVKWSAVPERFARLERIARLTRRLGERGFPVSAPIAALDGRLQVEVRGTSVGLQHRIEGTLLDTTDPDQVGTAGAVLARLQRAMLGLCDVGQAPDLQRLAARIGRWLADAEHIPPGARDALARLVADAPDVALPVQAVHGDFRSANVLCAGGEVVAVLDFEEARVENCIVEVARSAVLLGTRFRGWGPVPASVRAQFLRGYHHEREPSYLERRWWDAVLLWQMLAMVPHADDPTGWWASASDHLTELGRR